MKSAAKKEDEMAEKDVEASSSQRRRKKRKKKLPKSRGPLVPQVHRQVRLRRGAEAHPFHCRFRQWHVLGWFCWLLLALYSLLSSSGPDALHHGRHGPEGQLRSEMLVPQLQFFDGHHHPCRGTEAFSMVQTVLLTMEIPRLPLDMAVNALIMQDVQGPDLQHSCRGADADSLGLDCTADHRDSTVARGQGIRCPWSAGRAGFPSSGGDSRDPRVPAR